jgi:hypothetical protein
VQKQSETPKPRLTQVIAEREYRLMHGRKRSTVRLRFGKPRPFRDRRDFYCVYQIDGLDRGRRTMWSGGVDGVQALELAMQMACTELVLSEEYTAGRLSFHGSPDLGLPGLSNLPDLLRDHAARMEKVFGRRKSTRKRSGRTRSK